MNWTNSNFSVPDVGPCPDRLASGVGVPPDENKRPDDWTKTINE